MAEVRISQSGEPHGRFLPGDRLEVQALTLRDLIQVAYTLDENELAGTPSWLDRERYDIVAKTPNKVSEETLRLMLRSLLRERFELAVHIEDRVLPVFALEVGKRGTKLKSSATFGPWHLFEFRVARRT